MSPTSVRTLSDLHPREHETLQEAYDIAVKEAGQTGGLMVPATVFRQGKRFMFTTAIPMNQLDKRREHNSAPDRGTIEEVEGSRNRPIDMGHVTAIAEYVSDNLSRTFILPPATINIADNVRIHMVKMESDMPWVTTMAFLVIPASARFAISDGQHRVESFDKTQGLIKTDKEKQRLFDSSSLAVMITLEDTDEQAHQDFADCARTKPVVPSQLAVYDRRNPANGLVLDVIKDVKLFNGKIDATSKNLSGKSAALFLTNTIRQVVKVFLAGDYGLNDDRFNVISKTELEYTDSPKYKALRDRIVSFYRGTTESIPVFKEIATLQPEHWKTAVPAYREKGFICLTAAGLTMLARMWYDIENDPTEKNNLDTYVSRLGSIDWSKDAQFWKDCGVVSADGKRVSTGHKNIQAGARAIERAVGYEPIIRADESETSDETDERPDVVQV
ncbi:MAG TPA: DNA sulfur modification protein DndB [Candidatus Cybelea sp.]|jgi:DGQHR domain-containing protein|nr:DNA sulfur modification protein DndB [Candidatus Cybelea sp.]